jgi:hypothetical protein
MRHHRRGNVLAKNRDDQDRVDSLAWQYVTGTLSEAVFKASLKRYLGDEDIRFLVNINRLAHQNSLPYRKGEVT